MVCSWIIWYLLLLIYLSILSIYVYLPFEISASCWLDSTLLPNGLFELNISIAITYDNTCNVNDTWYIPAFRVITRYFQSIFCCCFICKNIFKCLFPWKYTTYTCRLESISYHWYLYLLKIDNKTLSTYFVSSMKNLKNHRIKTWWKPPIKKRASILKNGICLTFNSYKHQNWSKIDVSANVRFQQYLLLAWCLINNMVANNIVIIICNIICKYNNYYL